MIKGFGLCALAGLALTAFVACSEGDDGDPLGTGGTAAGGTGGGTVTGGTTGSGGDTTTTGGTTGSGGDTTTTGGTTGTGGEAGGGNVTPGTGSTFDADEQGWTINWAEDPGNPGKQDMTLQNASKFVYDAAGGTPGGAVKLTIPFSKLGQKVSVASAADEANPINMTGKTLKAQVKLVSGAGVSAKVYMKSAGWGSMYGAEVSLDPAGEWIDVTVDEETATYTSESPAFDITKAIMFGVEVLMPSESAETPAEAVILIDNVTYQ
jgi:hypothetical protein